MPFIFFMSSAIQEERMMKLKILLNLFDLFELHLSVFGLVCLICLFESLQTQLLSY